MFRFTIRDVLWLTVVVALACALLVNHMAWVKFHFESTASLKRANRALNDGALEMEREFLKLHVGATEPNP